MPDPIADELVSLTEALIRFQTMHSMPEEIERCARYIAEYVGQTGMKYELKHFNGVPMISVLPEPEVAPVLLMTHIDVVDGDVSLFTPFVKEGNLYGRGSLDDKYAAALSLVLLKYHWERLKESGGKQSDLPFGILITGDEEIGGENGAAKAFETIRTDFCIALDGGALDRIVTKEKGVLRLKLITKGKAAHGARPWMGENAVENLMADYQKLKAFFSPEAISYDAPNHWHRTMNLGIIRAGNSVNQVPDSAEALLDIRFTEHDDVDALVEEMQNAVQSELIEVTRAPLFYGGESPHLDLLLQVSENTALGAEHGASDARYLSQHGIPGIVWGADGDRSHHSPDEHINIASMVELYKILDRFLRHPELQNMPSCQKLEV